CELSSFRGLLLTMNLNQDIVYLSVWSISLSFLFFFYDTSPTEIYTLSLHDALPICDWIASPLNITFVPSSIQPVAPGVWPGNDRSEEHTSELQSHLNLVCRLLLEKKKTITHKLNHT